jgi:Uma2 family endonuclease
MTETLTRRPPAHPFHDDLITFDEFIQMDFEGRKVELIDGRLVFDDMPTYAHELLVAFLIKALGLFAEDRDSGHVLGSGMRVRVADRSGVQPDVLFVSARRLDIIREHELIEGPDIAIEVVSPSSRKRYYEAKRVNYEQTGVGEYWVVDPIRGEARFYRRDERDLLADVTPLQGEVFMSQALPGFAFDPDVLFADPLPKVKALLREMGA